MLRITGFAIAILLAAAAAMAPQAAMAWTERSASIDGNGGTNFTDPDQKVDRLTGSSADGSRDRATNFGSSSDAPRDRSGWSFSVTPITPSDNPSAFPSMFGPNAGFGRH